MNVVPLQTAADLDRLNLISELQQMMKDAESGVLQGFAGMVIRDGRHSVVRCNVSLYEGVAYAAMMNSCFIDRLKGS